MIVFFVIDEVIVVGVVSQFKMFFMVVFEGQFELVGMVFVLVEYIVWMSKVFLSVNLLNMKLVFLQVLDIIQEWFIEMSDLVCIKYYELFW